MKNEIKHDSVSKILLIANAFMACIYIFWWTQIKAHIGNPTLYYLLFFSEIYHITMSLGFTYTLWPSSKKEVDVEDFPKDYYPSVAVFVMACGEPVSIVEQTVIKAKDMNYPNKNVYILNDSYVANKPNWQEYEELAKRLNVTCITRTVPGGAKASNFNNGLKNTNEEFIALFDADMQPFPEFLEKTVPYFQDEKIGYVQSPQSYKNYDLNEITRGASEQQNLFFGPIMIGKNNRDSAFICGTSVVIRRKAIEEINGMSLSVAEDFVSSLFLQQKGWKSIYTPEILSSGLSPMDLLSYWKQQNRWATGSLEVLFGYNPLFKKGLSIGQKIQYLLSALYYLNGLIILIDLIMPLFFFFGGIKPVSSTTSSFALYFIPYMFLGLYVLYIASGESITFRAISFVQSSFFLQLQALFSVIFRKQVKFAVTSKQQRKNNYLFLIIPHFLYILLGILGVFFAIGREGMDSSVATNVSWYLFNVAMFIPFINSAFPWKKEFATT